jgi:hypothetical protein
MPGTSTVTRLCRASILVCWGKTTLGDAVPTPEYLGDVVLRLAEQLLFGYLGSPFPSVN